MEIALNIKGKYWTITCFADEFGTNRFGETLVAFSFFDESDAVAVDVFGFAFDACAEFWL